MGKVIAAGIEQQSWEYNDKEYLSLEDVIYDILVERMPTVERRHNESDEDHKNRHMTAVGKLTQDMVDVLED